MKVGKIACHTGFASDMQRYGLVSTSLIQRTYMKTLKRAQHVLYCRSR